MILAAIAFGLCYVALFTILLAGSLYVAGFLYFAWEDLRILVRRVSVAVGFGLYTLMILCMAVVILLGVFG
jgi:hypothetical protein